MIPLHTYRIREVRDLAWACFSPPLLQAGQLTDDGHNVAGCDLPLTPARRRWLQALDRDPAPLLAHLQRRPARRLGIYFEQLWQFFLAGDPAVELVAHNLPVREGGKTLGEFDCLYFCRERRRHYHLELAVKFFLGHRAGTTGDTASHWHEWLGPDAEDRLDRKIHRLFRRQLTLGETAAAREPLSRLGITSPVPELAFKGQLFQGWADPLPPPFRYNRERRFGQWLRIGELEGFLAARSADAFLVLPRLRWLAPALAEPADRIYSRARLAKHLHCHFATTDRALLVASLDGGGGETGRFFVTAEHWPGRASSA